MKDLIKSFNLYGKITEQHAKDIEEILENYEREVKRETVIMVCDKILMSDEDWCCLKHFQEKQKEIANKILKELL